MIKITLDSCAEAELIEIQGSKENREAFLAELNILYSQFKHRQDLSSFRNQLVQKPCEGCGESGF